MHPSDNPTEISSAIYEILEPKFDQSHINDILVNACDSISKHMANCLTDEIQWTNSLSDIYLNINKNLKFKNGTGTPYVDQSRVIVEALISFIRANADTSSVINSIDEKLKERYSVDFASLIGQYKNPNVVYDHGLYSCLYYLFCNAASLNVISDASLDANLKHLIWDADMRSYKTKLIDKYDFIMEQTAYSILCHNIYPENFCSCSKTGWAIKLSDSPFAYFCGLMDSLQIWGRQQYVKHSVHSWDSKFCHSNYNIYVKNDQLVVQFLSKIRNFEELKGKTIDALNKYLEKCTDYITIEITTD